MAEVALGWRRLRAAAFLAALLGLTLRFTATHDGDQHPDTAAEAWTDDFASWRSQNDHDIHRYVPQVFVDAGAPRKMIQRHHYAVQFIPLNAHYTDNSLRVTLWDHAKTPTAVFAGPPGFGEMASKDFVAWVSSGKNVVFLGGYTTLSAMNQLFGFQLEYVPFTPGPYWRNDRNVRGTPFQFGPDRLQNTAAPVYGVKIESIPITGYSMYDTYRDSAVLYIKYNLGTVCYLGADFSGLNSADSWGWVLRDAVRM